MKMKVFEGTNEIKRPFKMAPLTSPVRAPIRTNSLVRSFIAPKFSHASQSRDCKLRLAKPHPRAPSRSSLAPRPIRPEHGMRTRRLPVYFLRSSDSWAIRYRLEGGAGSQPWPMVSRVRVEGWKVPASRWCRFLSSACAGLPGRHGGSRGRGAW